LINAVLSKKKLVRSSSKPGRTKTLNFFAPGSSGKADPQIYLVDGPGYGLRGRPEWGQTFMDYVSQRRTLCRVFVLICLAHGLKKSDKTMLEDLDKLTMQSISQDNRVYPLSFQIVFTKMDTIMNPAEAQRTMKTIMDEIWQIAPACLPECIPTSTALTTDSGTKFGIERVRQCIAEAGGFI